MTAHEAILLFAHGARDPEWAGPVRRLASLLRAGEPPQRVEVAFLEFLTPSFEEAIERLVLDGARRVTVVPVFLAQGGHLKRDLPDLVAQSRERHRGCQIELIAAVGEDEGVLRAMAEYARSAARRTQ